MGDRQYMLAGLRRPENSLTLVSRKPASMYWRSPISKIWWLIQCSLK